MTRLPFSPMQYWDQSCLKVHVPMYNLPPFFPCLVTFLACQLAGFIRISCPPPAYLATQLPSQLRSAVPPHD